jgi:hypothetical protein
VTSPHDAATKASRLASHSNAPTFKWWINHHLKVVLSGLAAQITVCQLFDKLNRQMMLF